MELNTDGLDAWLSRCFDEKHDEDDEGDIDIKEKIASFNNWDYS